MPIVIGSIPKPKETIPTIIRKIMSPTETVGLALSLPFINFQSIYIYSSMRAAPVVPVNRYIIHWYLPSIILLNPALEVALKCLNQPK